MGGCFRSVSIKVVAGLLLSVLWISSAWAYRVATVRGNAGLQETPEASSFALEELKPGTRLFTSDRPTSGFFKVKTPSGQVGWVSESALSFEEGSARWAVNAKTQAQSAKGSRRKTEESRPFAVGLRVAGGFSLFTLANFNSSFNTDVLKNGLSGGIELVYPLAPSFAVALRAERILRGVTLNVTDINATYALTASATPVMLGAELRLLTMGSSSLALSGFGGLGLGTSFKSVRGSTESGDVIEYSGTPATFMGRLDWEWRVAPHFGLGFEAGYRLCKLSQARPSVTVGGVASSSSGLGAEDVNLSGVVLGALLSYWF
jgi:hypothetical protein